MESPADVSEIADTDAEGETTGTERAILGTGSVAEVRSFFSTYVQDRLGSPIAAVRFRAGRIDAVWGVELGDGREAVIKCHRLPAHRGPARTLRSPPPDWSGAVVVSLPGGSLARAS